MTTQPSIIPYFAAAPAEYDRNYISQVTRAFAIYAQQQQNPGPMRATTLHLMLPQFADNATAIAGKLSEGDVYKTATGEIRIVV